MIGGPFTIETDKWQEKIDRWFLTKQNYISYKTIDSIGKILDFCQETTFDSACGYFSPETFDSYKTVVVNPTKIFRYDRVLFCFCQDHCYFLQQIFS